MESKFQKHVDREEIVQIVCDLVRQNTVNPPGDEYLCKEIVSQCMQSLGMEISYYEKEPGRTLDDKGSFACAYSACKAFLAEHPSFDGAIYLIAAADEELGSELGIIYL